MKNQAPDYTPSLAMYQGVISRWCALNQSVPDVGPEDDRARLELDAFQIHLAALSLAQGVPPPEEAIQW